MIGSTSGRVLIAGTAALLLCLFLSPKFIEFLRNRAFGQNIREEGPEAHKLTKAGTPTMGGVIIILAFSVPFLILSTRNWESMGVFATMIGCGAIGFADDYTKIVKRRSLGLRARTKLILTVAISLGPVVVRDPEGGPAVVRRPEIRRCPDRLRAAVPGVHLPRRRRHDQRREPDRRPGWAGGGLRVDRAAGVHRDHLHLR